MKEYWLAFKSVPFIYKLIVILLWILNILLFIFILSLIPKIWGALLCL